MPAYITTFNFTDQGIRNVKDSPNRVNAFREAVQAAGGRLIAIWWTQGQFDGVFILDMPDDETATRMLLSLAALGNIRTTTLRAFSEEEMQRIVQGLA